MKQKEMARWLKVILVTAAVLLALGCFVILPVLGRDTAVTNPDLEYMYYPCLIFFWISAIPVYLAFWKGWIIFTEIGKDNSFCEKNAVLLRNISRLAYLECPWYVAGVIALGVMNLLSPGFLIIAVMIIFACISIAIVAAALSHLVKNASDLKTENDLTV